MTTRRARIVGSLLALAFVTASCASSRHPSTATPQARTVVYSITEGGRHKTVTFQTATGQSQQRVLGDFTATETMTGPAVIEAQEEGSGPIVCSITVNGVLVSSNASRGDFAIVTCSA